VRNLIRSHSAPPSPPACAPPTGEGEKSSPMHRDMPGMKCVNGHEHSPPTHQRPTGRGSPRNGHTPSLSNKQRHTGGGKNADKAKADDDSHARTTWLGVDDASETLERHGILGSFWGRPALGLEAGRSRARHGNARSPSGRSWPLAWSAPALRENQSHCGRGVITMT
jgi:hypothetical protein